MISTDIMRVNKIDIANVNRLSDDTYTRKISIHYKDYNNNQTEYDITCFADSKKELEITTTKIEVI